MKSKLYLVLLSILILISFISALAADENITIAYPQEDQKLNTSNINVNGNIYGNASAVKVRVGAGEWQTASINGLEWNAQVTLTEGPNTIYAQAFQTIDANETLIGETSRNVTLDSTLPTIDFTYPSPDAIVSTSTINVMGSAFDNNEVSLVEVNVNAVSWVKASGTASWSVSSINLKEGPNDITARATDSFGNTNTTSITVYYRLTDTEKPVIEITQPTNGQVFNTPQISVSGTASDNANVTLVDVNNGSASWINASGTESWSVSSIYLKEGPNEITARATDSSGNTNATSVTVTYKPLDAQKPDIKITTPRDGAIITTPQISVSGTAFDNVDVTLVQANNGSASWINASGTTTWSVSSINLKEGPNVITARATDSSGNSNETSVTVTYKIPDTQKPIIIINTPSPGIFTTSWTPVSGTASDNVEVRLVEVNNGSGSWINASGTTNWSVSSINLKEGENVITARATDIAGNKNEASVKVTVDTTQMSIIINNGNEYTNSTLVKLSLTSTAKFMSFSNDANNWTQWEAFTPEKSWSLSSGDGTKKVFFSVSNDSESNPDKGLMRSDSIILDTLKPEVTDLQLLSTSTPEVNQPVDITANVTDLHLDNSSISFSISSPDRNTSTCATGKNSCNFVNTSGYGRYNVTVSARDLAGNINSTEKTWFITTMKPFYTTVTTVANQISTIDALKDANTTIELVTSQGIMGNIKITMSNEIPPAINQSIGSIPFRKFIDISTNPTLKDNLNWMNLKIYYNEAELNASGLDESTLRILYFNSSSSMWETPPGGVNTTNYNNYSGYTWANVSHFTTFAVVGAIKQKGGDNPGNGGGGGGGSSSGGGGGGGGASGEQYSNIKVIEKYDNPIYKDKVTSYRFTHTNNPIDYLNITGKVNTELITVSVEVLKNTSSLVTAAQSGIVYMNANIWVGLKDFATPKNIKEAVISFRVENSWMDRNNILPKDVKLLRWDGSKWITLETSEKTKESKFTHFEATTNRFSPFTISALKEGSSSAFTIPSEKKTIIIEEQPQPLIDNQTKVQKSQFLMKWFVIIVVLFVMGLIIEVYHRVKKK